MTDSPLIITSVYLIFLFFQPTYAETFFERRQRRVVVSAPLAIFTRQVCNKSRQIHQNTSLLYWTSAQKKRGIPNVDHSVLWHPLLSLAVHTKNTLCTSPFPSKLRTKFFRLLLRKNATFRLFVFKLSFKHYKYSYNVCC